MNRNLTDDDIEALAKAIQDRTYECRFSNIHEEDLKASVDFYKHFNQIMEESGSTIRKTLISGIVTLLLVLLGLGIVSRLKAALGL